MKHYILSLVYFLLLLFGCINRNEPSEIELITTGFEDSTKLFLMDLDQMVNVDTGFVIDNHLVFHAEVEEPTRFVIKPVIKKRSDVDNKYFWKENNRITIHGEKGNMENAVVEGSLIQEQEELLKQKKMAFNRALDSLQDQFRAEKDPEKRHLIREKGREFEEKILNVDIEFIKSMPDQLYAAYLLETIKRDLPEDKLKEIYSGLSDENKKSKYGIIVGKFIDLKRDINIGDTAVNFTLPDLEGNMVSLNDFKGKYVLLDFWASGCGPCRIENPNILRLYRKYREEGFEVLSVSMDYNRSDWEKAVRKDTMIWTTVADLKGANGDVAITYDVFFLPTYYIIDKEGIIIDKIMGRGKLDEKITALFEK